MKQQVNSNSRVFDQYTPDSPLNSHQHRSCITGRSGEPWLLPFILAAV